MKLYKHEKSSNWWYEFSIANKRYRRSTKRPLNDKKGAYRVMMNDYNELMNKVQLGEKPEITLGEAFDEVLETLNTENTFKGYRSVKASAVKFWGAEIKLSKINQFQIEEYANHLRKEGMALPELAILMGHSHHAMTLKYTHLARGDVVMKAREIMNA